VQCKIQFIPSDNVHLSAFFSSSYSYRTRIEYGVVLCYTRQQSIQVRPIRDSFADAIIYKQLPQGTRVSGLGHASNKGIDPGVMLACHCHPSAEACWAHHLKFTQLIDV
jgi:hypothetical protein